MFDPDPSLDQLLRQLLNPGLRTIEPGLERVVKMLAALGNPERSLPPVVHIAGTNGKGSTLAMLKAILQAGGLRCHRYTSPHLVRFAERIEIAGEPITQAELVPILNQLLAMQERTPTTFFEATTVAALLAFSRHSADVTLLETGMGGRLDATNVLAAPALSIIAPIGIDHAQFLGDTLAAIAAEKAAILKAGVPAVIGPQPPEALAVIEAQARVVGAPLYRAGEEWDSWQAGDMLRFRWREEEADLPLPALPGPHQIGNAGMALAASHLLTNLPVTDAMRADGLRHVTWPARLQPLTTGYWADGLPAGVSLIVDGGHNPMAGHAITEWAGGKRIRAVVGMLKDKDAPGFLSALAPCIDALCAITLPIEEPSQSAEELAVIAARAGIPVSVSASVEAALADLSAGWSGDLVICGSLYLAGWILARN